MLGELEAGVQPEHFAHLAQGDGHGDADGEADDDRMRHQACQPAEPATPISIRITPAKMAASTSVPCDCSKPNRGV